MTFLSSSGDNFREGPNDKKKELNNNPDFSTKQYSLKSGDDTSQKRIAAADLEKLKFPWGQWITIRGHAENNQSEDLHDIGCHTFVEEEKDLQQLSMSGLNFANGEGINSSTTIASESKKEVKVAIVGMANVGKSSVFNKITRSSAATGNWYGVTTTAGEKLINGVKYVDLPGFHDLSLIMNAASHALRSKFGNFYLGKSSDNNDSCFYQQSQDESSQCVSVDQFVTIDHLRNGEIDHILHVTDIDHLRQGIILNEELKKFCPYITLLINKMDLAARRGMKVDAQKLSNLIGVSVVLYSASKKGFIAVHHPEESLKTGVHGHDVSISSYRRNSNLLTPIKENQEKSFQKKIKREKKYLNNIQCNSLVHEDKILGSMLDEIHPGEKDEANILVTNLLRNKNNNFSTPLSNIDKISENFIVPKINFSWAQEITSQVVNYEEYTGTRLGDILDNLMLRSIWGGIIFAMVMFFILGSALYLGGIGQDFLQYLFETFFMSPLVNGVEKMGLGDKVISFLSEGFGVGISTLISFICPLFLIYFFISLLEESGYMARASLVALRVTQKIGLPGKSLIPLILGFGCNVTAIMGARIIPDRSQRLRVIMMIPFITCSARLAVLIFFARAFFDQYQFIILIFLYLLGIFAALITALVFGGLKKRNINISIEEIPDYNLPNPLFLAKKALIHTKSFIFGAAKIILPAAILINLVVGGFINKDAPAASSVMYQDGKMNAISVEDSNKQVPSDNKADDGYKLRQERKNSVLSNKLAQNSSSKSVLNFLSLILRGIGIEEGNWPALAGLVAGIIAKETVLGVLHATYSNLEIASYQAGSNDNIVMNNESDDNFIDKGIKSSRVESNMIAAFGSVANAFSYMVFVLLYFPCISVFSAISRELGYREAIVMSSWSTVIAYFFAVSSKYIIIYFL